MSFFYRQKLSFEKLSISVRKSLLRPVYDKCNIFFSGWQCTVVYFLKQQCNVNLFLFSLNISPDSSLFFLSPTFLYIISFQLLPNFYFFIFYSILISFWLFLPLYLKVFRYLVSSFKKLYLTHFFINSEHPIFTSLWR